MAEGKWRHSAELNSIQGRVSDVAIWDIVLNPAEIVELVKGISANEIRPEHLIYNERTEVLNGCLDRCRA